MPTGAINKLQEIVANEKKHKCTKDTITIREKITAPLNHVVINGISDDVIAIEMDKIGFGDKTFFSGYKARKGCDAVIFCQLEGQGYILILDLKSSIPSDDNHIAQLVSGDCFADYLISVIEKFEQIKIHWQRRYFIFHCANNKRTTLPEYAQNPPHNTRADKTHILQIENGEHVPLRKLLNKPL